MEKLEPQNILNTIDVSANSPNLAGVRKRVIVEMERCQSLLVVDELRLRQFTGAPQILFLLKIPESFSGGNSH